MWKNKRRYTRIRIEAQKLNKWKCKSKMSHFILKIWINLKWMNALIFQNFAWVYSIFFIIYLVALRPTLDQLAGSLTHLILITLLLCIRSEGHQDFPTRLGPKAQPNSQWELNREPFNSDTTLNPLRQSKYLLLLLILKP